ncbi:MAG TPA: sodium-translocating pyrophosphatase, partial [Planctomycetes bacterium]|nr:sodium-translocating pyrophosphatase [Planctomycetota bacterium]
MFAAGFPVLAEETPQTNAVYVWLASPAAAVAALVFAVIFYLQMKKGDEGTELMKKIAEHVRKGAKAYLKRQYKVVAIVFILTALFFAFLAFGLNALPKLVPAAFLLGGFFSALAGWVGMATATQASNRTAAAARTSLNAALQLAFRSGAVMGLVVVGLALVFISGCFAGLYWLAPKMGHYMDLSDITVTMLCFGMGASMFALFARVGGGIFTKAADVGADLVGKVEANIPEDDPRNPAVIADNVGDNVGDVAGMGADLYESYCGSILAAMSLGVSAAYILGGGEKEAFNWVVAPMALAGIGTIASIIGVFFVKTRENAGQKALMRALNTGIWASSALVIAGSYLILRLLLPGHVEYFWSIVVGLLAGIIIGLATER